MTHFEDAYVEEHKLAEKLKIEIGRLKVAIDEKPGLLDALIKRYAAEDRARAFKKGMARAGAILEALNMSVKWELAEDVKRQISETLTEIRGLLEGEGE